jgi:hypothetical protein
VVVVIDDNVLSVAIRVNLFTTLMRKSVFLATTFKYAERTHKGAADCMLTSASAITLSRNLFYGVHQHEPSLQIEWRSLQSRPVVLAGSDSLLKAHTPKGVFMWKSRGDLVGHF